ncbi:hypothetical protein K501DRAFT_267396 [Backusella circina FSU 941]|nr:hypothetical protein K501DRAFT_267396 [Backusella circina FSU 941]
MPKIKYTWIEEDMKNGLGDIEDHNISLFIERIREKGKAYEEYIFQSYLQEAKLHHPLAYAALGHFYRYGVGVPQDHIKAILCYIKASALGHKPILIHVARRFCLGEGVSVNYSRAVSCYFTCMTGKCDVHLCHSVTKEIVKIYLRINNSRFSLTHVDEPGFMTVDERRVEAVLDIIGAQLKCVFDYPKKHKRRSNQEIYLRNIKKLEEILDAFSYKNMTL